MTGADDQCGKGKIDNNGRKREKQIETGMTDLTITKTNQRNDALSHPEKQKPTGQDQGSLPGLDMPEIVDQLFHGTPILYLFASTSSSKRVARSTCEEYTMSFIPPSAGLSNGSSVRTYSSCK